MNRADLTRTFLPICWQHILAYANKARQSESQNYRKLLPWPEFYDNILLGIKSMGFKQYKYYFTKPRSEIGKDILYWLMIAGLISIAATSPYFVTNLLKKRKGFRKYPQKKISSAFYNLKRQGLINVQEKNRQIYISLTKAGQKKAGWLQIDKLKIIRPKRWDGKWRMVMFDIAQMKRLTREAFRGKLKELGFQPFQKSIWIFPFDCRAEIDLLQKFFNLSSEELRLIIAEDIGNDKEFRKIFNL